MITVEKAGRYIKLILFFACAIPMFFYIDGFISIGGFGFMYHYLYGMGIMLITFIFFLKDPDVWYTLELLKDGAALALVYVLMVLWSFVIWSIQFEGQETIIKGIFENIYVLLAIGTATACRLLFREKSVLYCCYAMSIGNLTRYNKDSPTSIGGEMNCKQENERQWWAERNRYPPLT